MKSAKESFPRKFSQENQTQISLSDPFEKTAQKVWQWNSIKKLKTIFSHVLYMCIMDFFIQYKHHLEKRTLEIHYEAK